MLSENNFYVFYAFFEKHWNYADFMLISAIFVDFMLLCSPENPQNYAFWEENDALTLLLGSNQIGEIIMRIK